MVRRHAQQTHHTKLVILFLATLISVTSLPGGEAQTQFVSLYASNLQIGAHQEPIRPGVDGVTIPFQYQIACGSVDTPDGSQFPVQLIPTTSHPEYFDVSVEPNMFLVDLGTLGCGPLGPGGAHFEGYLQVRARDDAPAFALAAVGIEAYPQTHKAYAKSALTQVRTGFDGSLTWVPGDQLLKPDGMGVANGCVHLFNHANGPVRVEFDVLDTSADLSVVTPAPIIVQSSAQGANAQVCAPFEVHLLPGHDSLAIYPFNIEYSATSADDSTLLVAEGHATFFALGSGVSIDGQMEPESDDVVPELPGFGVVPITLSLVGLAGIARRRMA